MIGEDVRGLEGFPEYAGRYNSLDEALKGGMEAKAQVGRATEGMVKFPGDTTTDDERGAFYNTLGRPEASDGYTWEAPEGLDKVASIDEERMKAVSERLHAAGVSDAQYKEVMDVYVESRIEENKIFEAHQSKMADETTAALKEEWGADYDKNIKAAESYAQKHGVADLLKGYGIINEKPVLDLLYRAAMASKEDGVDAGGNGNSSKEEQLAAVKASKAYNDRTDPGHRAAIEKAMSLRG